MKTTQHNWRHRLWGGAGVLAAIGGFLIMSGVSAQSPFQVLQKPSEKEPAREVKDTALEKLYELQFNAMPWPKLLDWLARETGMHVFYAQGVKGPAGLATLTVHDPGRKYTLPEVIDIINEAMRIQQHTMIRRDAAFVIYPADTPIPSSEVQTISFTDLPKRGKTEIVRIIMPVQMDPQEIINPLKKLMSTSFGEVHILPGSNRVDLQDTAAQLRRVLIDNPDVFGQRVSGFVDNQMKKIQAPGKGATGTENPLFNPSSEPGTEVSGILHHRCVYVLASDAEDYLRRLLGDSRQEIVISIPGSSSKPVDTKPAASSSGTPPPGSPGGGPPWARPRPTEPAAEPRTTTKIKQFFIASDNRSNYVTVRGDQTVINQAKSILTQYDTGTRPRPIGDPYQVTYTIPGHMAAEVVRNLPKKYNDSTSMRIAAIGTSQIMVWADPGTHFELAELFSKTVPAPRTEVVHLSTVDAVKLGDTLKNIYGGDGKTPGSVYIEPQIEKNAILVRGTREQVDEVKATILAIEGSPGTHGTMMIITVDKGSGRSLAEVVQEVFYKWRPDQPVQIGGPGAPYTPYKMNEVPPLVPLGPKKDPHRPETPTPQKQSTQIRGGSGVMPVSFNAQEKEQVPAAGGKLQEKKPPIVITYVGNKMIVSCDDPKMLPIVQQAVRFILEAPGISDFEVIPLINISAVEASRMLDEMFNGPKPAPGGGGGSGGRGRGGPGGGGPGGGIMDGLGGMAGMAAMFMGGGGAPAVATAPREDRIRVVADTHSNKLLVRANPLDMHMLRKLVRMIDADDTGGSKAIIKTHYVRLKLAHATEVAEVIRDVYKESMNNLGRGPAIQQVTPFGGVANFGRAVSAPQNLDAQGNPRGVLLSVASIDRTNTLVIGCPDSMMEEIDKHIIKPMEEAASDNLKVVQVYDIPSGVDPAAVQLAVDTLYGRRPTTQMPFGQGRGGMPGSPFGGGMPGGDTFGTGGGGRFGGGGGFNPGGFTPGGFNPGGFNPGGFTPGGFNPGATPGGFNPGGAGRGGGGVPGGGGFTPGGGRGTGGGTRGGGRGAVSGGPDFFEQRVTDDPRENVLFDPRDEHEFHFIYMTQMEPTAGLLCSFDDEQEVQVGPPPAAFQPEGGRPPQVKPLAPPGEKEKPGLQMPRLNVQVEIIQGTNKVILLAQNKEDMAALLKIIEAIQEGLKGAEAEIRVFDLQNGDSTTITNILNQLFSRLSITPNYLGTTPPPQGRLPGAPVPGGPGGGVIPPGQGQNQPANIVAIALPYRNAILVAAPKARIEWVKREIARLDRPGREQTRAVPYRLTRAPAQRVAIILTNFYNDRYPNFQHGVEQVRFTYDEGTNTLFVQAPPNDMREIEALIRSMDEYPPAPMHDLKVIQLRSALSDDLAAIIRSAIAEGILAPITNTQGTTGTAGGGGGGAPAGGQPTGVPGQGGIPGRQNAAHSLKLVASRSKNGFVEAGFFDDIRITSYPTNNLLVISAPPKTMELILELVHQLDLPPTARAQISVYTLKRADATSLALMLQQLYLVSGAPGAAAPRAVGATGGAAAGGGLPGAGGAAGTGTTPRLQISLQQTTPEGYPLIDLRITVDERTNSLIVAGSRNDLNVIEAVIDRLESADVPTTRNSVAYRLTSALAPDVAVALQTYIANELSTLQTSNYLTPYQNLLRNVVVTPEPITNTLILGGAPAGLEIVKELIKSLDMMPPQVLVQVLVAEVDVNDDIEFGVELGLQTPLLFYRSLIPNLGNLTGSTVSYAVPTTAGTPSLIAPGTTVSTAGVNSVPSGWPGLNFNGPDATGPLGQNPLVSPVNIGVQGITNLGVGRISSSQNIGGFVYSMQSDFLSVLVRALKTQGRMRVLSRPQLTALDNQTALLNVGQRVPINGGGGATPTGTITTTINFYNVGVNLQVTPKIMPDGKVLMRVIPEVSSVVPTLVNVGNGTSAAAINLQHFESTVAAMDGETIVMGGMIQKQSTEQENKVPWLGDLPHIGALFRYRTRTTSKTELLVILTPHVIRCGADHARVLADETKRIQWIEDDVVDIHGTTGAPLPPSCCPPTPLPQNMMMPQQLPRMPQPTEPGPVMPPVTRLPQIAPQTYYPSGPSAAAPLSTRQPADYGQPTSWPGQPGAAAGLVQPGLQSNYGSNAFSPSGAGNIVQPSFGGSQSNYAGGVVQPDYGAGNISRPGYNVVQPNAGVGNVSQRSYTQQDYGSGNVSRPSYLDGEGSVSQPQPDYTQRRYATDSGQANSVNFQQSNFAAPPQTGGTYYSLPQGGQSGPQTIVVDGPGIGVAPGGTWSRLADSGPASLSETPVIVGPGSPSTAESGASPLVPVAPAPIQPEWMSRDR